MEWRGRRRVQTFETTKSVWRPSCTASENSANQEEPIWFALQSFCWKLVLSISSNSRVGLPIYINAVQCISKELPNSSYSFSLSTGLLIQYGEKRQKLNLSRKRKLTHRFIVLLHRKCSLKGKSANGSRSVSCLVLTNIWLVRNIIWAYSYTRKLLP